MSTGGSDRELLFGLLAFQNSFIDRETLLGAFQLWMEDKSRSLSSILRETGKLPTEQADLLEALVNVLLQQHRDDPQQSLAAISSLGSVRQDLQHLGDADLLASLGHVSVPHPVSPDDIATLIESKGSDGASDGSSSATASRFRVLRPHARGGLGAVFVAVDNELNREVALKEIQTQHADNLDNRERFVREALVTGGLEHPNIVPIYGLGTYADGRPYYAMRFVKGDSLQEAIEAYHQHRQQKQPDPVALNLELRKLLGRFIDVCNAMEYAHSRGVLHRDLKPGNIMLGKYGETLVVDWGLAKPLGHREKTPDSAEVTLVPSGSGSSETLPGSTIGTPAYMSPEQAAGKLEELGPSSDVYSLGATLYHLLTGKAPFQGEAKYVLGQVMEGTFKKPRAVAPHVPAALEAICLKGMFLNAQDRYQTPRQLADDVEHWLADQPVTAYREDFFAKFLRFFRKDPSRFGLLVVACTLVGRYVLINMLRLLLPPEIGQAIREFGDLNLRAIGAGAVIGGVCAAIAMFLRKRVFNRKKSMSMPQDEIITILIGSFLGAVILLFLLNSFGWLKVWANSLIHQIIGKG